MGGRWMRDGLRDGVRRIEAAGPGAVVSPCDGRVVHCGTVELRADGRFAEWLIFNK